ncbi:MAG: hypothetical protein V4733_08025 [Verrucomicrobiota bacterium]
MSRKILIAIGFAAVPWLAMHLAANHKERTAKLVAREIHAAPGVPSSSNTRQRAISAA